MKEENRKNKIEGEGIDEIRSTLAAVDAARTAADAGPEERTVLELSAQALRDAERVWIRKQQKEISASLTAMEEEMRSLSREIRERVDRMNRLPGMLKFTEKFISEVTRVLRILDGFM